MSCDLDMSFLSTFLLIIYALQIFEAPETLEQRVVDAAVPGDVIRFSLTANMGSNVDRETNSDDVPMISVEEDVGKDYSHLINQINLVVLS